MASQSYAFRPMAAADLPTVRRWLAKPHVAEWWGDPDGAIRVSERRPDLPGRRSIHRRRRRAGPFAYLQCYDPGAWPRSVVLARMPSGTRGIDQFIGEARHDRAGSRLRLRSRLCRPPARSRRAANLDRPRSRQRARHQAPTRRPAFASNGRSETPDGAALLMVPQSMTDFSPREIVSELDRFIVGQADAKRAVAIALRNRWRRLQLDDELREEVLPKNILMIGPDRRRQDRDLAPAGQARRRAVPQGGGHQIHRGRLCRPRRRADRARPGRDRASR